MTNFKELLRKFGGDICSEIWECSLDDVGLMLLSYHQCVSMFSVFAKAANLGLVHLGQSNASLKAQLCV